MSQIEQTIQAIQSEFRLDNEGRAYVSIRGAARLADIDAESIGKALRSADQKPSSLSEFLAEQGFRGADQTKWRNSGIPDTALALILEYYAYETQERYRSEQAKLCCRAFRAIGIRLWLQQSLNWNQRSQSQAPYFYQRILEFKRRTPKLPSGYFCIFNETIELVSALEQFGYNLPDHCIIDISIGKCFCNFMRKELNVEPDDVCLKYPHWYPGQSHSVKANLYPLELLPTFRNWLDSHYYRGQMLKYFKGNAPEGLEAVQSFVALLPAA